MAERSPVCSLDELDDPGSRGFSFEVDGATVEAFVVQRDGEVFAYRNSCPHTGATLDWIEHQFLDLDQAFIQCAVHDARFEMDTGLCIAGPCSGESLQPIAVEQIDGMVFLVE